VTSGSIRSSILSAKIAKGLKIPAFTVEPVTVDELMPEARITGLAGMHRISVFHALNQKAVAKRFTAKYKLNYNKIDLIIVHLGGGISVGAHRKGKVIDVNNPLEEGPFSPERSGSLPGAQLVKLCYSGKYTEKEVLKMLAGKGGLYSHFGTNNCRNIEKMIKRGNKKATLVYHAMALAVSKHIGAAAAVLSGDVKAILLTGGLAKSKMLINLIKPRIKFIAPVHIYPGEDEMTALAEGVLRVLTKKEKVLKY
jgi:butyrate kinase